MASIEHVNSVLKRVHQGEWPNVNKGKFVPGAFSSGNAKAKKYWKTNWPDSNTLLFYGMIDYDVFWWPDTIVYQKLSSIPKPDIAVGFMHPNKNIHRVSMKSIELYLKRFQGVMWESYAIACIPCIHRGTSIEEPDCIIPLIEAFEPVIMKVPENNQRQLVRLAEIADILTNEIKYKLEESIKKGELQTRTELSGSKQKGVNRPAESIVEGVIAPILSDYDFYRARKGILGLWREPKPDFHFEHTEDIWPRNLFVEIKTTEDVNAPIVQAVENLAYSTSSAVIQIRIIWPGNKNPQPHPVVLDAKKQMEPFGVFYKEIKLV